MATKRQVDVGARIAEARRAKGLSQRALGEAIGTSIRTIQTWEGSDRRHPRTETLLSIAEVTERPVSWFYEVPAPDPERSAAA